MELEIIIPFIPTSWNKLKGRGWVRYKRMKDESGLFLLPVKQQAKGYVFDSGAMVTFIYGFTNNRRRDIDSLCTKPIIDALVDMGIFTDDNKNVIVEKREKWEYTEEEQTRIIISDGHTVPTKTASK